MGFFSSMFSAVSSGFSAICSGVSNVCSAIGSGISGFVSNVLPKLATVIGGVSPVFSAVVNIASTVLQGLGILNPKQEVQELGERVLYAKELGMEIKDFPKYDDYLKEINTLDIDNEKISQYSPADRQLAGLMVGAAGLDSKFNVPEGTMGNLWILAALKPEHFTADRLQTMVSMTTDIKTIVDYFSGDTKPAESLKVEASLVDIEKKINPDISNQSIFTELDNLKEALSNKLENP